MRATQADDQTFVLGLPPIEARLRLPATDLMYEVCRVQKLDPSEIAQFDDAFIDHLFDLVEVTRDQQDERLNYAMIKFIIALNEQFMVATLPSRKAAPTAAAIAETTNLPTKPTVIEKIKQLSIDTHVRNHQRAHTETGAYIQDHAEEPKKKNRVLMVLMRRLGNSKTFGENVIFMLNRAGESWHGRS
jgi:hypothetical protein